MKDMRGFPNSIESQEDFETVVRNGSGVIVVCFYTVWCGPCLMLREQLREIAHEEQGAYQLRCVDVDEHQRIAGKHGIKAIPTFEFYKNGERLEKSFVGADPDINKRILEELEN